MMNTKTKLAAYIAKAHAENTLPVVTNGNVDIAFGVGATLGIAMVLNDWADAEKAHADRIKDESWKWAKRQSDICQASRLSQIVGWSELPHTIEQRVAAHHKFVDDIKKHVDCTTDVLDEIVMHVRGLVKAEEHSRQRIKAALHRIQHGQPVTRIPAHETDADVVLMACRERIKELESQLATCTHSYNEMVKDCNRWATRAKSVDQEHQAQGYWAWQDDGTDDLESLTCPVLISAPALRRLVAAAKAEAPKAQTGELQDTLQAVVDNEDYVDTGHQIAIDALAKLKGVSV